MFIKYGQDNSEILQELLLEIPDTYQKTTGFIIWDFLKAVAIGFSQLLKKIYDVNLMHDVTLMKGEELTKFVKQRRGVERKSVQKSSGYLDIMGDFMLKPGDLFATAGGVIFEVVKPIIGEGLTQVAVQCQSAGSVGNVLANTIVKTPVTIIGVVSVVNPEAFTNGYNEETDEALIERYLEDLSLPLTSGNKYHYKKWAKEVEGVGDARVFPLANGANTVKVLIIDSNYDVASPTLVSAVQLYIDPNSNGQGEGQAPCGAYCTVESATAKKIIISVNIQKEAIMELVAIKENIFKQIKEYLKIVAFKKTSISFAQIGACILQSDGVIDFENLRLNGGGANIALLDTEIGVMDIENLEVVESELNA